MPKREQLEQLKKYPVFQHWRAKAETHALQFRPQESARLQKQGKFQQVLDQRTESFWNALVDARSRGANLNEAEELALPNILLPSENEEAQDNIEQLEQMESQ